MSPLVQGGMIGLALIAAGMLSPLRAAKPPGSGIVIDTPIVELPKFEVTDSRMLPPPEKWHYAEIPGFEILSNTSERETKRFVKDFLLLQEAMNVIMPGLRPSPIAVPTSLILTGRGDAFNRFVPTADDEARMRTNSYFFNDPERSVIIVDFELAELRLEDNTTIESDAYRSFYKEYFRHVIRRNVGHKPPAWFEEGLVQLFAGIDFNKKWISFAMIGDGFGGERTGDFNRLLTRRALLPMGELLADPPTQSGTFWSAQAYAFVHMCLYGRNLKYQRPFIQFIRRLDTEPLSEELFKECFKMDYKKMALEIRGYVDFTDHKYMQFTAKKGQSLPEPPDVTLQDAPDAVAGRLVGEALRLGGHGADAHNVLIAPYVRGQREPRLLAAIGLDEKRAGNDERALKFLNAAADAHVDRARAYLELGRLRLDAARATLKTPEAQLDPAQVSSVLTPLFEARKQKPPLAEVYAMIAETWALSATPPQRDHLEVVLEGVRIFPRDTALLLQATLLAARRGFPEQARALAQRGVKLATEPGEQDRFRAIGAAFERDVTEPSATPGPDGSTAVPATAAPPAPSTSVEAALPGAKKP